MIETRCENSQSFPADNVSETIETVKSLTRRGSRGNTRLMDEEDFFEDSLAFEDDFSIGIELSGGALDLTSGTSNLFINSFKGTEHLKKSHLNIKS